MKSIQSIGIIGAGLSGLIAAKTALEYGYEVSVFEKDSELGGVWATSKRYTGVRTQNTKDTYHFSDFPMPKQYPQWPEGAQVQAYLTAFAAKFGVLPKIRFGTEIIDARYENGRWGITCMRNGVQMDVQTDFLIVCNGTFSDPYIPELPGMDSFIDAGGEILHSTGFKSPEIARGKRVAVVGYSKSAHDVVTASAETAASAHLVFREAKWKIPHFVKGLNAKYLVLSRLGEALIKPDQYNPMERFVNRTGLAGGLLRFLQGEIRRKQKLDAHGLLPACGIKDQAFGELTMETPGFFRKLDEGRIALRQGEIVSFRGKTAVLSSGGTLDCDMVVFATGFRQNPPAFLSRYLDQLLDEDGNYLLYRHILPAGIPALAFVGYNSSLQSTISAEFAALWVCEYLKGRIPKLTDAQIRREGAEFIRWRSQFRTQGASRGLSTMPGTIHHVDILLRDMKAPLPLLSQIPDWLLTINPRRYKALRKKILARNSVAR